MKTVVQFLTDNPFWLAIVSLAAGIILTEIVSFIRGKFREAKEVKENQSINLSGTDWFAAWQAAVDSDEIDNTEAIIIKQSGATVYMKNVQASPENPKGGYKWKGKLTFSHGESLMGWYYPIKSENITSKGIMFFAYDSQRKVLLGKWVGKAIDGPLCNGFVVISKNREKSLDLLNKLKVKSMNHPVNIISTEMIEY